MGHQDIGTLSHRTCPPNHPETETEFNESINQLIGDFFKRPKWPKPLQGPLKVQQPERMLASGECCCFLLFVFTDYLGNKQKLLIWGRKSLVLRCCLISLVLTPDLHHTVMVSATTSWGKSQAKWSTHDRTTSVVGLALQTGPRWMHPDYLVSVSSATPRAHPLRSPLSDIW